MEEKLKTTRSALRGHLTKVIQTGNKELSKATPDVAELQRVIQSIRKKLEVLTTLDSDLLKLIISDEVESECEVAEEVAKPAYKFLARAEAKLRELEIKDQSDAAAALHAANLAAAHAAAAAGGGPSIVIRDTAIRKPELNLRVFSGEREQYCSWFNLFSTCIGNDASLSDTAKFQYLLTLLQGEALSLVKHLDITDDNYALALTVLRTTYVNQKVSNLTF